VTEISSPLDAEDDDDVHFSSGIERKNPEPFNQLELDDLIRDLDLTKKIVNYWGGGGARLKKILARGTVFYW
jgi:hypothetical protein